MCAEQIRRLEYVRNNETTRSPLVSYFISGASQGISIPSDG